MKKIIFGAIASCCLFSGCNNNNVKENLENCDNYEYKDSIAEVPVYGFVTDADGSSLSNVLITSGKDTTFSAEDGSYSFKQCRLVNGRSVVKFEKDDYFSVVRTANVVDGGARLDAVMMAEDCKEGVTEVTRFASSQGTTITVGKMTIFIPANALVYEKDGKEFNGSVFASTYYLNPNSENFTKEMPGGDMSGVTSEGKSVILLSYGMVEVTLRDSARQKLQLKEGVKSDLSFPVPEGFSEEQLHDQIPLWYFDEEKGTWIEESVATKNESLYSGKVSHFSWHNLDYPSRRATIKGQVQDTNGNPIPDVLVTISQTSAYSNNNGYYSAFVPMNTPVFVTVKPQDYGNYSNAPIYRVDGLNAQTEYIQDITLPIKKSIHGKVTNKEGYPVHGISVSTSNGLSTVSNRKGEYRIYLKNDESFSVTTPLSYSKKFKSKKYEFDSPSDVIDTMSYNFVVPRSIRLWGYVGYRNNFDNNTRTDVTIVKGNSKTVVPARYSGSYSFYASEDDEEDITAYVEDDVMGIISNTIHVKRSNYTNRYYYWLPDIYLNDVVFVKGSYVNTCGPSISKVTIDCKNGRTKKSFTQNAKFGYFNIGIPVTMKDWKVKLKVEGYNKRFSKKIDLSKGDIDLGTIEYCSGEKPEPDCIYAVIGDKTIKFDTKKDVYCEMLQQTPNRDCFFHINNNIDYKHKNKCQIWYKSPDYNGTLIVNIESVVGSKQSQIYTMFNYPDNYSITLITDDNKIYRNNTKKKNMIGHNNIYPIYTDMYLKAADSDDDDDEVYLFGSTSVNNRFAYDNIDKNYISKQILDKSNMILIGESNSTKFFKSETGIANCKQIENALKAHSFKEKNTFVNDEGMVSTIYVQNNASALLRRNEYKADVTVLFRDGIGNEPTSHCWKVDFRKSSAKKKGDPAINYMWKNEADIIDLIMFGQLMGIKFTKTDITEDKCGCATGNGPAVAN